MRWSEARSVKTQRLLIYFYMIAWCTLLTFVSFRYLPGDFDAFDAFDDAGNPPVYFWTRYLRIQVPVNWFSLFEEARRRQRMWNMDIQRQFIYQQQQHQDDEDDMLSFPAPPSSISSLPLNDDDDQGNNKNTKVTPQHSTSFSQSRHGAPTIFSDLHTTHAPISDLPLSSSSSSKHQQFIYSPTPSLRHVQKPPENQTDQPTMTARPINKKQQQQRKSVLGLF